MNEFMKHVIKLILTTLLLILFLLLASWFYRILVLMLLARVWRERIKKVHRSLKRRNCYERGLQ